MFGKEALKIPHLKVATIVDAFKIALKNNPLFYEDLVMTPCKKLDEVSNKALRFTMIEKYKRMQKKTTPLNTYGNPIHLLKDSIYQGLTTN